MQKYACSECSYVYNPLFGEEDFDIPPMTEFENIEHFNCPSCGNTQDNFMGIIEEIHTPIDIYDLLPIEEMHIPRYYFSDDILIVQVGNDDTPHPEEEEHFIEWIAVYDVSGDMLDIVVKPKNGMAKFDGFDSEEEIEVRSSCNIHGIWKGIPN